MRSETRVMWSLLHANTTLGLLFRRAVATNVPAPSPPVGQNRAVDRDATSPRRLWLALATVVAAYGAGVWVIGLATEREIAATVWPAAGLCALAALIAPRRQRPVVVAAVFLAYAAANLTGGRPLLDSVLLGVCGATET